MDESDHYNINTGINKNEKSPNHNTKQTIDTESHFIKNNQSLNPNLKRPNPSIKLNLNSTPNNNNINNNN